LRRAHPSSGGSFRRGRSCELYVTYAIAAQEAAGFAFIFFETTNSGIGTFETCQPALKMSVYRGRPEVVGVPSE
jgi:hypothetical protein